MSDSLQKVLPGQQLRVPAKTYNRLMDMLRWWLGQGFGGGAGGVGGGRDLVTVRVENASGHDLEQYDILGLTQADQGAAGVWPKPADNLDAFCEGAVFTGHVPDLTKHVGRFAVVLEPVADGQMCRAAIAGVVPVYVTVQDEDDQWADINDGNHETLLSGKSGAAQLLFKEEGVGDKWCLARLGPPVLGLRYAEVLTTQEEANDFVVLVSAQRCLSDGTGALGPTLWLKCTMDDMVPGEDACPVGFKFIAEGDVIAYLPGDGKEIIDGHVIAGQVIPYGGTTGARLYALPYELDNFWAVLTSTSRTVGDTPAVYDFDQVSSSFSGQAAEKNGNTGIAAGKKVRVFPAAEGFDVDWAFEYGGGGGEVEITSSDRTIGVVETAPDEWDLTLLLTSDDQTVTLNKIEGGWDLSAPAGVTYEAGSGIAFTVGATTTVISVNLATDPGLQFIGIGSNELAVLAHTDEGIHVDADGVGVTLASTASSSLGFDEAGAVFHEIQSPTLGTGVPTGISGENLAYAEDAQSAVFDPQGHYNPDTTNTQIHDTPGASFWTDSNRNYDANGHIRGWYADEAPHAWYSPWGLPEP